MSDLSYLMFHLDDALKDEALYHEAQRQIIISTLRFHVSRNHAYHDYYTSFGLKDPPDADLPLSAIPLLPSSLFKRRGLVLATASDEQIIKRCTSSGTRGSISSVPRDEQTLTNFLGSISSALSCFFNLDRIGNHKAFILGPMPEEAGDLWFSYVLSSMALSFHTEYCEKHGKFRMADAASSIQAAVERRLSVFIIGPPFRIVELCGFLEDRGSSVCLSEDSFVISAGGWKDKESRAIPRVEYIKLVAETFNIDSQMIRDSYNMVELNTVLNECEFHEKHVLPWVDVVARDPSTNHALGDDEPGILSFCDGSALSYPGFILSEDYGVVSSAACRCGRFGKRVEVLRRIEGLEARGCALKMAGSLEPDERADASDRFFKSVYRDRDRYR
jgi:long-chain-fatty-acid---luciferin-component ligase